VNNAGIAGFPAAAFTSANAYVKYAFPVNQSGTLAFPLIGVLLTSASGFSFINQFTNAAVTNVQLSGQTVGFGVCYPHS